MSIRLLVNWIVHSIAVSFLFFYQKFLHSIANCVMSHVPLEPEF